jgi:uncharacterized protein (TIGR02145 family)
MTTYSFIKYNVLKNIMYFKSTPTPDFKQLIKTGGISTQQDKDIIQGIQSAYNNLIPQDAFDYIKSYLEAIPELNLGNSNNITLRVEIDEDTDEVGTVLIISQNLDNTLTTINVPNNNWPTPIASKIKLPPKYPTLGKCKNCLKFTFDKNLIDLSWKNFTGNIGGDWDQTYFSGQKVYDVLISDYTDPFTGYGATTLYKLLWKPNLNQQTVNVPGVGNINVPLNSSKWILLPASSVGNNWQSSETFYHILSGPSASCPYTPNPDSGLWNFFGENGRFLLEEAIIAGPFQTGDLPKLCPDFKPSPGPVDWGYNCDGNGNCVGADPGTTGSYATLEQCQTSCTPPAPTSSFNCTFNGCVQVPSGSGSFATLEECQISCDANDFITTCSCDDTNIISNPSFSDGYADWVFTPNLFSPGIGVWINQGDGTATVSVESQFNADFTSSVFISQLNALNISCSYEICFQAWAVSPGASASISLNTGVYPLPLNNTAIINDIPTAYSFILTAGTFNTTDLTVFVGSVNGVSTRVKIDNFCVKRGECLPDPQPEDCIITGSAFCYTDIEYPCECPEGYTSISGSCVQNGVTYVGKQLTGTPINAPLKTFQSWGINSPFLYYYYSPNTGIPSSSIAPGTVASPSHPSPFFGNPNVYNTAYTFDLLKNSFWRGYSASPSLCGYSARLFRQIPVNGQWYGGGSYINISSSKTYYVGLIGDDRFRFRVNGTTIAAPNPADVNTFAIPSVQYPQNPYITNDLTGVPTAGAWTFRSLHIYPVTLPSGCNYIQLEGKDNWGSEAGFGGVIFDMTAEQLVSASSENDLNVIWDSRNDLIFNLNTGITASCPSGSTPVGPSPCDLCEISGSVVIPCGSCIECTMGWLYNGYIVDQGGPTTKGRGTGGIVNTDPMDNPINTWVIPDENDWNTLITYLDDGSAISNLTPLGGYNTNAGGEMKDYTRDLIASCWSSPNVGAQNDEFTSGWAGMPGGIRKDDASYYDLGTEGTWWSANSITPTATTMAVRNLKNWSNDVYRYILTKNHGCSIRLVRPAEPGEAHGTTVLDAYVGNDGILYDGIVIGTQVWITKNLSESEYNNGNLVSVPTTSAPWINALTPASPLGAYYADELLYTNGIIRGNINPATGLCYEYPTWFVYRRCGGTDLLIQTEQGATTTPGKIQKADDYSCWEFVGEVETNTDITYQLYITGNYFENNPTVYTDCEECTAIHTIYLNFGSKNC